MGIHGTTWKRRRDGSSIILTQHLKVLEESCTSDGGMHQLPLRWTHLRGCQFGKSNSKCTKGLALNSGEGQLHLPPLFPIAVSVGAFCALCPRCAQSLYRTMPNLHSSA